MKKEEILRTVAVVVLNYITYNETKEFVASLHKFYPGIRTIIVDNGSDEDIIERMKELGKTYENVTVHPIGKNLGFARGNNIGIRAALREGYRYIVCTNNDILFKKSNTLEILKDSMEKTGSAIIGPRILNLKGKNQNPFLPLRPSQKEAKRIYKNNTLLRKLVLIFTPESIIKFLCSLKHKLNKQKVSNKKFINSDYVYALNGAFLIFGPLFFEFYNGFDEGTFLYGEEIILAEMLFSKKIKAFYESRATVIHKEDRTSSIVWGSEKKLQPQLYSSHSVKYWYKNFYLKNQ